MGQKTRIQKSIENPVRSSESNGLYRGLNISRKINIRINELITNILSLRNKWNEYSLIAIQSRRDYIFIEKIIKEKTKSRKACLLQAGTK